MMTAILLAAMIAAPSVAQIRAPNAYRPFEPIVLSVADKAKEGQRVHAVWRIDEPAKSIKVGENAVHVWAPPKSTAYKVIALVFITESIEIDGRKLDVLVGAPRDHEATFTVSGDAPPPPEPGPGPEPEPEPPEPEPEPEVPADRFDNIGRKVANAAKGLPLRKEVAANYRQHADLLAETSDPQAISNAMVESRTKILGSKATEWASLLRAIVADFNPRVTDMKKQDVVDYWQAVATGLDPGGAG